MGLTVGRLKSVIVMLMKTPAFIGLLFLVVSSAFGEMDASLLREIKDWKKGSSPPPRLLKFPDGKIDRSVGCGMRVFGSAVEDYISQIQDADLLAALAFDIYAKDDTFQSAVSRLI